MRVRVAPAALLALAACSRPAPPEPPPAPAVVVTPGPAAPADASIPPPREKPGAARVEDTNQPRPYARFTFEDDEDENLGAGKATLLRRHAPVCSGAVHLNGVYPLGAKDTPASVVTVRTRDLVYDGFTVAVRFRADGFAPPRHPSQHHPVVVAGQAYRWFALSRNAAGNLVVELNQGRPSFEVKAAPVEAGRWAALACSVDVPRRRVLVFADGRKALDAKLPPDFEWKVAAGDAREADKVWLFVNYANGLTFRGEVDELLIYDTALNADQLARVPLRP